MFHCFSMRVAGFILEGEVLLKVMTGQMCPKKCSI